ncbi:MAG: hypothetical protein QNJ14_12335 [Woeseiaceae bacterium]|nr:hypothetical protein [Woeseiaceae bacterium]
MITALSVLATVAHADDGARVAVGFARQGDSGMPGLGTGASIGSEEYRASAEFPISSTESRRWSVGLEYGYTHFDYDSVASRNRDLHRIEFPVRVVIDDDEWQLDGLIAPGIATSSNIFKDFLNKGSHEDLYLSGRVEARRPHGKTTWLAGVAYDRSFGDERLYPIAGILIEPSPDVALRIAYPDSAMVWKPSDRYVLSGRVLPAGFEWRVVQDDLSSEFVYRTEGIRSQLTLSHGLWRQLWVDLFVAYEFERRHEFATDGNQPLVSDVDNEWLVGLGFSVGAPFAGVR